ADLVSQSPAQCDTPLRWELRTFVQCVDVGRCLTHMQLQRVERFGCIRSIPHEEPCSIRLLVNEVRTDRRQDAFDLRETHPLFPCQWDQRTANALRRNYIGFEDLRHSGSDDSTGRTQGVQVHSELDR